MLYNVFLPEFFTKIVRDLKKKSPSVTDDLKSALRVLEINLELGKSLQGLGHIEKLRAKNSDAVRGKRGGYRLIYLDGHADA